MIAAEWKSCRLGDVVTLQRGFDLPKKKRKEGSVPIVSSSGVSGYHDTAKVHGPGVITGRYGTLGEVFYVGDDFWPLNTTLYVRDFKGNDAPFVSYFLRTLDLAHQNAAGAVPGLNRNALHLLPVRLPPLTTQRKIASVLSAYDDLIENNIRRIEILEDMARRIYQEWFVHFRFPGHEKVGMVDSELGLVPERWESRGLFDVAEVAYGFPFKSKLFTEGIVGKPVIRIRDIRTNETKTFTPEAAKDRYLVHNGDLLVGMDGDFHMGKWAGGEAYLNQRVVRFRPNPILPFYYLFLALHAPIQHFNSTIVGTTVAHLSDRDLRTVRILVPDEQTLNQSREVLDPIFRQELVLRLKNANLRRTRNLLLPKLITGEVSVQALGIASEDADVTSNLSGGHGTQAQR